MPLFEYKIINPKTGRRNTKRQYAFDGQELLEFFEKENIEYFDMKELPPEPATDKQLELMREQGIPIPDGLSIRDASALITTFFDKRPIADAHDFEIAKIMRVEVSQYSSKKAIYQNIFLQLTDDGDTSILGSWYAYRVYRDSCTRGSANEIRDPLDGRFQKIGKEIASQGSLERSLWKASETATTFFRYFGTLKFADGDMLEGDSTRTAVYKFVFKSLCDSGVLDADEVMAKKVMPINNRRQVQAQSSKSQPGVGFIILLVAVIIFLLYFFKWMFL